MYGAALGTTFLFFDLLDLLQQLISENRLNP